MASLEEYGVLSAEVDRLAAEFADARERLKAMSTDPDLAQELAAGGFLAEGEVVVRGE